MDKPYSAPKVSTLGTVAELTEQNFNKVGANDDQLTTTTPPIVVGSLTPIP